MSSVARRATVLATLVILLVSLPTSLLAQDDPQGFQLIHRGYGLSLHKEMFMMPVTYSSEYHGAKTEAVFQLSAKHRLFNTPIYFGYTQISFWQAYDQKGSSPFRETNYNPEIFYRSDQHAWLGGRIGADVGFEHESNGQKPPVSRSWNLLYASPYYARPDLLVHLKLRYRLPEDEKESPDSALGDDNPDIIDYYGHGDINVYYRFASHHMIHVLGRGNVATGKGYMMLNYSVLLPTGNVSYLNLRVSHGYGESLVDYNRSLTRIGVGLMFNR